jgi:hypothetical protein
LAPAVADLDSIISYSSQFYPSTPKKFLDAYYDTNGKKAGVYTFRNGAWTYSAR